MMIKNLHKIDPSQLASSFAKIPWDLQGKVQNIVGTVIEAFLPKAFLGTVCEIEKSQKKSFILAQVVGFKGDKSLLLPYSEPNGIGPGNLIKTKGLYDEIFVGKHLLGRVLDPFLNPLDGKELKFKADSPKRKIDLPSPNPLTRSRIHKQLPLGIRSIDSLLSFAEGQRTAVMAGSGVGKSVLLGMMAKGCSCDINVIALIGERGREVKEFIEKDLGPQGLARSIVIAVTSDESPLMKLRGAKIATTIAEHFSEQGKRVLLMMDSLTRVAQAQREIGIAVGEPPASKGYTPSVFSLLPKLLERCGTSSTKNGSISGIYTVLVDGDDFNDPIPDAVRSIMDGHINLSRDLAQKGHFPAIEISSSASRVMIDIKTKEHILLAQRIKKLISLYNENEDFLITGNYQVGMNLDLDLAIKLMPQINNFLQQDLGEISNIESSQSKLKELYNLTIAPKKIKFGRKA